MTNGSQSPEPRLEPPASSLDIEQIWYVAREKAWLIALCALIGIFGGLAYIHRTPLTYYAQAVIEVDPEPIKVVGYNQAQDTKDPISEEMGQTLLAVFRSRQFAQEVIENYKLLDFPAFLPPRPDGKPYNVGDATGGLIGMEHVTLPLGTRFIDVGVTHSNPVMAQQLADILANHYIARAMKERSETTHMETTYLAQKADEASENLKRDEEALNDYVRDSKQPSLVEAHDTVVTELQSKNANLIAARAELVRLEADDEQSQVHQNDKEALLAIPSVANDPAILEYKRLIDEIQSKIQVLKLRYTEKHPKLILARTQLADAQNSLNQSVLNIPSIIHSRREAAEKRVAMLSAAVNDQQGVALQLDYDRVKYDVLTRKVETDRALYDSILNNVKAEEVATGMGATNMHVFESAQVPMDPMQPRKSKTLSISLAGGLLFGLLLSFGFHMLDSSIKSVDQAEEILGLTVLTAIPRQAQRRLKESGFALLKAPSSPVAEAFRTLRTSIYLAGRRTGRKIILFTSALAGEGKTFCSTNYATALSQQGLRTLLIDADLRSPMIAKVLLPGKILPGLSDLLSNSIRLEEAIHPTDLENLWVLPAGGLVPNPAELLARGGMEAYMRQIEEKFDRVVIDTAPVTAVSDTLLLIEHAQAICLVFHAAKTPRKWILRAIKLIAEAGSKPSGTIVNQVPQSMAGAYTYYPGRYGEPSVYGSANGASAHTKAEPDLLSRRG